MAKTPSFTNKSRRLFKILPPAFLLTLLVLFWPAQCLCARCEGELLVAWPISAGERFELTFTHSLNQSPVTDVILWTGEDLVVEKSIFKTFGGGIPIPSDGIGERLVAVDGHYELVGINRHMQSLTVLTQTVPDHVLTLRGSEARLIELAGTGRQVEISVSRVSLAERIGLS